MHRNHISKVSIMRKQCNTEQLLVSTANLNLLKYKCTMYVMYKETNSQFGTVPLQSVLSNRTVIEQVVFVQFNSFKFIMGPSFLEGWPHHVSTCPSVPCLLLFTYRFRYV